ncbi:MAG: SusC/RagA family TonB-linked outer membrane protein, partial [Ferruginibacter sp.]
KGKVTDANGVPISAASIRVKNTKTGTSAASDGTFSINASPNSTLIISGVGYEIKEVAVGNSTDLNISLQQGSTQSLNEVVVTALGIKREKKALGYSVSTVAKKDLELRPEGDIGRVLTGKAAGVNIINTSGISGSGTNITIRAVGTITGNSTPLFIVDGVPFDGGTNANTGFTYGNQTSSRFLDLDPNNIENVSILKGLSATTIYGEYGRNGVILITTKNGGGARINKKAEISVSQSYFVNNVANLPEYNRKYGGGFDLSNGVTFFSNWGGAFSDPPVLVNHPYGRAALNAAFPQFKGAKYEFKAYKNNVRDFFRDGTVSNTSVNIGGSGTNASYNGNFSYLNDIGFLPGNDLKKMTFGIGGNAKLANNFTLTSAFTYVTTKVKSPPTSTSFGSSASNASAFGDVLYTPTSVDLQGLPFENPLDHSHVYYRSNNGIQNPRWTVLNSFTGDDVSRIFGNIQLKYDFTKKLNLSYRVGFDNYTESQLYAQQRGGRYTPTGILRTSAALNTIWDQTVLGNYNTDLSSNVKLGVEAGVNVRNDIFKQTGYTSTNQLVYGLLKHNNFIDHQSRGEDGGELDYSSELETIGAFAFATLGYKEYLFLNLGGRESYTSALEKNNRKIFYPSVNLSLIPTAIIPALRDNKGINYLKLRVAYGTSAEFPGLYATRPTLGISTKVFVDNGGTSINTNFIPSRLPNRDLKPALLKEYEVGAEGKFFDNRISLDLSLYDRNTKDQILNRDLDPSTGFTFQTINGGNVNNKGIELGLGYTIIRNKNWKWQVDGLFTKNKSLVSDIPDGIVFIRTAGFTNLGTFAINGQPLGVIQGVAYQRSATGERIVGTGGDYLTNNQISILGDPNPDYKVTGITSVSFKALTFRIQMEYTKGGDFYSATSSVLLGRGVTRDTEFDRALPYILPGVLEDGKTPNNQQISATQAYFNNSVAGGAADEAGIYDGTNIRIREASFSYNLPQSFLKKSPFGAVAISISGTNLYNFAPNFPKYIHFDPETSGLGVSNGKGLEFFTGPSSRRIGASIRVTF